MFLFKKILENNLISENELTRKNLRNIRNQQIFAGETKYDLEFFKKSIEKLDIIHLICPICTKNEEPKDHIKTAIGVNTTNAKKYLEKYGHPDLIGILLCYKQKSKIYHTIADKIKIPEEKYFVLHEKALEKFITKDCNCKKCQHFMRGEIINENESPKYEKYCRFFKFSMKNTKNIDCVGFEDFVPEIITKKKIDINKWFVSIKVNLEKNPDIFEIVSKEIKDIESIRNINYSTRELSGIWEVNIKKEFN